MHAHLELPASNVISVRHLEGLGENAADGEIQVDTYAHIRRLPPHGRSPFRSCPRLVLSSFGFTFGRLSLICEWFMWGVLFNFKQPTPTFEDHFQNAVS